MSFPRIADAPDRSRPLTILFLATLGALVLRLAIALRLPLLDDEAYYWLWSHHLAWSYPDHPPMIAALIALGTSLFGNTPLAIRFVPLLLASATPLLGYLLGRDLFDSGTGRRAVLLLMMLPIFALGTSFAFPDGPMALFWLGGAWTGWRALRRGGWWWVATGAAAGLSFLSKEMALFLILGLAAAWAADPARRSWRDQGWYAGLAIAAALIAPVLVWNARHGWAMIDVTLTREAWTAPQSVPENLLAFAGGLVLFHGPLVVLLGAAAIVVVRRWHEPAWRYIAVMSLPIFIPVVLAATAARAKPHWPSPAFAFATIALAALWPQWSRRRPLLVWVPTAMTVALTAGLAAVLFAQAGTGIADRWETVVPVISREATARQARVYTSSYQSASQILYQVDGRLPVTADYGAFRVWYEPEEWIGRDVLYVDDRDPSSPTRPRRGLPPSCRDFRLLRSLELSPRRVLDLYFCRTLSGP